MTEVWRSFWCWLESALPQNRVQYVQALIALLGFLIGIFYFWLVKRRENFKLSTDLILKLSNRFGSVEMYEIRANAAKALTVGSTDDSNVDKVLDFFEELGFLLRRGAIDAQSGYMFFSYTFWTYFHATGIYRHLARKANTQDVWRELEAGYRMIERERYTANRRRLGGSRQRARDQRRLCPSPNRASRRTSNKNLEVNARRTALVGL